MEPQNSRRKQCRPARSKPSGSVIRSTTADSKGQSGEEPPTSENLLRILEQVNATMMQFRDVEVKTEPIDVEICSTSGTGEMCPGQVFGPFKIRPLLNGQRKQRETTLFDPNGSAFRVEILTDDFEQIFRRLRCTKNMSDANCMILQQDDVIHLVISKPIRSGESLTALCVSSPRPPQEKAPADPTKKFSCDSCRSASFHSMENLIAHKRSYCRGPGTSRTPTPAPPPLQPPQTPPQLPAVLGSPLSHLIYPNNVLFLPLAFHDLNASFVQFLGPPQTVVPIAVGKQDNPLTTSPLIVNQNIPQKVPLPSTMTFSAGNMNVTVPIMSAIGPPENDKNRKSHKRPFDRPTDPLDLSKRERNMSESGSSVTLSPINLKPAELEKPFMCSCGIGFSAEDTLNAHKKTYCKDVRREERIPAKETARKLPSRCNQCDFEPNSVSQLSVHIRQAHSDVQAYVCTKCGYRGYSLRGIRSHLRSHTELDNLKTDILLSTHVQIVKHCGKVEEVERQDTPEESISE